MQEARVFKELVIAPTSKALVHVFFSQRSTTKVVFQCSLPFFYDLPSNHHPVLEYLQTLDASPSLFNYLEMI